MLIFEDEDLKAYLQDDEVGYGDKLTRIANLLGPSKVSIINRIIAKTDMTNSSRELFEATLYILDRQLDDCEIPTKEKMENWRLALPVSPPTITGGALSTQMKTSSYGLVDELHTLVTRVGVLRAGYILEKLTKGEEDARVRKTTESA